MVFGWMWPDLYCRPLAHHRSKTKHARTQRESAPYGTILNSGNNKDKKKRFQMKKKRANSQFGLYFLSCLFRQRVKPSVCLRPNKGVKLFLCLLSCITTRLRMCTCVCRLPSSNEVTKPRQTAAPRARFRLHCYHGNTGRDNQQPTSAWRYSFTKFSAPTLCLHSSSQWPCSKIY